MLADKFLNFYFSLALEGEHPLPSSLFTPLDTLLIVRHYPDIWSIGYLLPVSLLVSTFFVESKSKPSIFLNGGENTVFALDLMVAALDSTTGWRRLRRLLLSYFWRLREFNVNFCRYANTKTLIFTKCFSCFRTITDRARWATETVSAPREA